MCGSQGSGWGMGGAGEGQNVKIFHILCLFENYFTIFLSFYQRKGKRVRERDETGVGQERFEIFQNFS